MDYRRLAGTDIDLSVLCFGPTRTAAPEPGDDPRTREGTRAFFAVLESGINCIHSSYEYRLGSMSMMSSVLKDHPKRHDIHHIVKVPAPDFEDDDTFTEARFRQRIEEALSMFHAERIAVVQYMWRSKPNDEDRLVPMLPRIIDDVVGTFERMRDEGKVGCLMTFPYTVPAGQAALDTNRFSGLLGYYNPLTMELTELFSEMERRELGFIAIRPYYEGLLTDKRPNPAALPADDRLHAYDVAELFRRRDAVAKTFAEEIGGSMTRFALRFPLFSELTATVVVGLNTEKQVSDAVGMVGDLKPRPELIRQAFDLWKSGFSTAVPA
jgi:aryl-alcohol dehydrogenase-like predicted oxidoreductase